MVNLWDPFMVSVMEREEVGDVAHGGGGDGDVAGGGMGKRGECLGDGNLCGKLKESFLGTIRNDLEIWV